MNVAIIGTGAIGGWIAARLALAGNKVAALSSRGPVPAVALTQGGRTERAEFSGFDGAADVAILAVKAPALADAALAARPLIGPRTSVVPMVNGVPWWFTAEPLRSVDPGERIAGAIALDRVVGNVVHASCRRTGPAEVEVVQTDRLILGEPAGAISERAQRLCAVFEESGLRCDPSADIRRAIWYKLWGNATINPLSALTRSTADKLLADPALRALMAEAMDELAAVGSAIGCPVAESAEARMEVTARLGAFRSSMLQDVEAGRPIELEALVGAPIEIARRNGIPTPQLDRIYATTRLMADNLGLL